MTAAARPKQFGLEGLEPSGPTLGVNQAHARTSEFIGQKSPDPSNPSKSISLIDANNLLTLCHSRGIRLYVEDSRLLYDAPHGMLDDAIRPRLKAQKTELIALLSPPDPDELPEWGTDRTDETSPPPDPDPSRRGDNPHREDDPLDRLRGPRRPPWGTLCWSDPNEPEIEAFGPCPDGVIAGPAAVPTEERNPWTMPVPRARK